MQHDITHCDNDKCPKKEYCYRWQAYQEAVKMKLECISCAIIEEDEMLKGECPIFWEYENK